MSEVDIHSILAAKVTKLPSGRLVLSLHGDGTVVHMHLDDTDAMVLQDVANELLEQKRDEQPNQ